MIVEMDVVSDLPMHRLGWKLESPAPTEGRVRGKPTWSASTKNQVKDGCGITLIREGGLLALPVPGQAPKGSNSFPLLSGGIKPPLSVLLALASVRAYTMTLDIVVLA